MRDNSTRPESIARQTNRMNHWWTTTRYFQLPAEVMDVQLTTFSPPETHNAILPPEFGTWIARDPHSEARDEAAGTQWLIAGSRHQPELLGERLVQLDVPDSENSTVLGLIASPTIELRELGPSSQI